MTLLKFDITQSSCQIKPYAPMRGLGCIRRWHGACFIPPATINRRRQVAHIVILGAGIGGMTMAYEMREQARSEDKVTVISNNSYFQFTPSNPWVGVNWRTRDDITIEDAPYRNKKNIDFIGVGAARVHPQKNQIELPDGKIVDYDFLVI